MGFVELKDLPELEIAKGSKSGFLSTTVQAAKKWRYHDGYRRKDKTNH